MFGFDFNNFFNDLKKRLTSGQGSSSSGSASSGKGSYSGGSSASGRSVYQPARSVSSGRNSSGSTDAWRAAGRFACNLLVSSMSSYYKSAGNNYQSAHSFNTSTPFGRVAGAFADTIYTKRPGDYTTRYNYESTPQSQWRAPQAVAYARMTGDTTLLDQLPEGVNDRASQFYNPYMGGRSTFSEEAMRYLAPYMEEGDILDQKWLDKNRFLRDYNELTKLGAVSDPGKRGSDEEWAAYWYNRVAMNIKDNDQINEQYAQYRSDYAAYIQDFQRVYGRNPSLQEVNEAVPISNYSRLATLDESYGYEHTVPLLPYGTFYSSDIVPGLYYAAINGDDLSADRDYMQDAVDYYCNQNVSAPAAQQYEWNNKDLGRIAPEERDQRLAYLASTGDMEQYMAFRKSWFDAQPHADGVAPATGVLDSYYGFWHDDDWASRVYDAIGDQYESRLDEDGKMAKPGKNATLGEQAAYELYEYNQNREYTNAVESSWNQTVEKIREFNQDYRGDYDLNTEQGREDYLFDLENALNLDDMAELKGHLKNPKALNRPVFATQDNLNIIMQRALDGKPIASTMDYTVEAAYYDDTLDEPVETPPLYEEDQRQAVVDRRAERAQGEEAVVQATAEFSNSAIPVAKGALPLFPPTLDLDDEANIELINRHKNGKPILKGLLARLWFDNKKADYDEKLGEDYTVEDAAASDPVLAQLDTDEMADEVTGADLAWLGNLLDLSRVKGEDITLVHGIIGNAVPALTALGGFIHSLYEKYDADTAERLAERPIDTVAYKTVYEERVEAGSSEDAAVRTAYFAATEIPATSERMASAYEGDSELSESASDMISEITREEGSRDTLGIMADMNDGVRDVFGMERAEDEILTAADSFGMGRVEDEARESADLFGMERVSDEDIEAGIDELNDALILGASSAADPGYQAQTNQFLYGYMDGSVTSEDILEGVKYRARMRRAELAEQLVQEQEAPQEPSEDVAEGTKQRARERDAEMPEQPSEELPSLGLPVQAVRINGGKEVTPEEYREYILGEAREWADSSSSLRVFFMVADYSEISPELKEYINYDELMSRAEEMGISGDALVGEALDSIAHPDKVYHTTALMRGYGTDFLGGLNALGAAKSEEEIAGNLSDAERGTFARFLEDGRYDTVLSLIAFFGYEQSDAYRLSRLLTNNGKYMSRDEVAAAQAAYFNGTATYDEIERLVYQRKDATGDAVVSWLTNPKEAEASDQRIDEGLAALESATQKEEAIEALDYEEERDRLIREHPELLTQVDINDLRDPETGEIDPEKFVNIVRGNIESQSSEDAKRFFDGEQIEGVRKLAELKKTLGQDGYILSVLDNESLKAMTNGDVDLDAMGLDGYTPGQLMSMLDADWLKPYGINPGAGSLLNYTGHTADLFFNTALSIPFRLGDFFIRLANPGYQGAYHRAAQAFQSQRQYDAEYEQNVMTKGQAFTSRGIAEVCRNLTSSAFGAAVADSVSALLFDAMADGNPLVWDAISNIAEVGKAIDLSAKLAGRTGMIISSFTNDAYNSLEAGDSILKATMKGIAGASIEFMTEDLGLEKGMSFNLDGQTAIGRFLNSINDFSYGMLSFLGNSAKSIVSEVGEEEASVFLNRVIDFADYVSKGQGIGDAWRNAWDGLGEEMKQTAVATAFSTLLFGVVDLGGMTFNMARAAMERGEQVDTQTFLDAMMTDILANIESGSEQETEYAPETEQQAGPAQEATEAAPEMPQEETLSRRERRMRRMQAKAVDEHLADAVKDAVRDPSPENLQKVTEEAEALKAQERERPRQTVAREAEMPSEPQNATQEPEQPRVRPRGAVAQEALQEAPAASESVQDVQADFVNLSQGAQQTVKYLDGSEAAQDKAVANRYAEQKAQEAVDSDPGLKAQQDAIEQQQMQVQRVQQEIGEQQQAQEMSRAQLNQVFSAAFDELIAPDIPSATVNNPRQALTEKIAAIGSNIAELGKKADELYQSLNKKAQDLQTATEETKQSKRQQFLREARKRIEESKAKRDELRRESERLRNEEAFKRGGAEEMHNLMTDEEIREAEDKAALAQLDAMGKYAESIQSGDGSYNVEDYTAPMQNGVRADNTGISAVREEAWREEAEYKDQSLSKEELRWREDEKAQQANKAYLDDIRSQQKSNTIPVSKALYDAVVAGMMDDLGAVDENMAFVKREAFDPTHAYSGRSYDANGKLTEEYFVTPGPVAGVYDTTTRMFDENGDVTQTVSRSIDRAIDDEARKTSIGNPLSEVYTHVTENNRYLVVTPTTSYNTTAAIEEQERYDALTKRHALDGKSGMGRMLDKLRQTEADIGKATKRLIDLAAEDAELDEKIAAIRSKAVEERTKEEISTDIQLSKRKTTLPNLISSAQSTIRALEQAFAREQKKYEAGLKFVQENMERLGKKTTGKGKQNNQKQYIVIDKEALYRNSRGGAEGLELMSESWAAEQVSKLDGMSDDELLLFFSDLVNEKYGGGENLREMVQESFERLSHEDRLAQTYNLLRERTRNEMADSAFRGVVTTLNGNKALNQFVNKNGGYENGRDTGTAGDGFTTFTERKNYVSSKDTSYQISPEAAYKYLSEKERKSIGLTRSIEDYNEDVLSLVNKYLRDNEAEVTDMQRKQLMRGLQIDQVISDGKPHYTADQDSSHALLIAEDRRNDPDSNLFLRPDNVPGRNLSIAKAKWILNNKINNILKIANGEQPGWTVQPGRDSIQVKYVDDLGTVHTRKFGEMYTDEDGTAMWLPSLQWMLKNATEITANFSAYQGDKFRDISRVYFKLVPNSLNQQSETQYDYETAESDTGYMQTMRDIKDQIKYIKNLIKHLAPNSSWRNKLYKWAANLQYNMYMNGYQKMIEKAANATPDTVDNYADQADEYWKRAQVLARSIRGAQLDKKTGKEIEVESPASTSKIDMMGMMPYTRISIAGNTNAEKMQDIQRQIDEITASERYRYEENLPGEVLERFRNAKEKFIPDLHNKVQKLREYYDILKSGGTVSADLEDREDSTAAERPAELTAKQQLEEARERYRKITTDPVYSDEAFGEDSIFAIERELLARLMIPYYERMAEQEAENEQAQAPAEQAPAYSEAEVSALQDKYADTEKLSGDKNDVLADLGTLKDMADSGMDVAETRTQATEAYHQEATKDMTDGEKSAYAEKLADYAKTFPDTYIVDPNTDYDAKLTQAVQTQAENIRKADRKRLKSIGRMAGNYRRLSSAQSALQQLEQIGERSGENITELRNKLQDNIARLENPNIEVAEQTVETMLPEVAEDDNAKQNIVMQATDTPQDALDRIDRDLKPFKMNLRLFSGSNAYADPAANMLDMMRDFETVQTGNEEIIARLKEANAVIAKPEDYERIIADMLEFEAEIQEVRSEVKEYDRRITELKEDRENLRKRLEELERTPFEELSFEEQVERRELAERDKRIGRKMAKLIDEQKPKIEQREQLKSNSRTLQHIILGSEMADRIINNRGVFFYEDFKGETVADKRYAHSTRRFEGHESARKFLKALSKNKIIAGETVYNNTQLANAAREALDEEQLALDRETANVLGHAVKDLKYNRALLKFEKVLLADESTKEQIDAAQKQALEEIMELYPEREYTKQEEDRQYALRDRFKAKLEAFKDHIHDDYMFNSHKALYERVDLDMLAIDAAIERGENIVKMLYRDSTENLQKVFSTDNGGHDPASVTRMFYAIVRDNIKAKNPIRPIKQFLDTFPRYIRSVMSPQAADAFISHYIQPVRDGEANIAKMADQLHKQYEHLRKLDAETRSAISICRHHGYGEAEIRQEYGEKADAILNGMEVAGNIFDTLNRMINVVYGRNGLELLKRRDNYVPFIDEEKNPLLRMLGIHSSFEDVPTGVLGKSGDYVPAHEYFRYANARKGNDLKSHITDIVKLLDIYIPSALNQIYQTDNVVRLDDFIQCVEESGNIDDYGYADPGNLANFAAILSNYRSVVAGKKVGFSDRAVETQFSRKVYSAAKVLTTIKGQSATFANFNVSAANFEPVAMCLGLDPEATIRAIHDTIESRMTGRNRETLERSRFYTTRNAERYHTENTYQKIAKKLNIVAEATDSFTSEIVTRACQYMTAKRMGNNISGSGMLRDQMIVTADNMAINIMASRARGEKIQALNSSVWSIVGQFLLEPMNNNMFMLSDLAKYTQSDSSNKIIAAISGTAKALAALLVAMLGHEAINWTAGRQVVSGPISDIRQAINDRKEGDSVLDTAKAAASNVITDFNPFDNLVDNQSNIPIIGGIPIVSSVEQVFTESLEALQHYINRRDEKRNGTEYNPNETDYVTDIMTVLSNIMPGGVAAKRLYDTAKATRSGYVLSEGKGRLKYTFEPTVPNLLRSGLFGPNSSREGQAYVRSGYDTFSDKDTKQFLSLTQSGYDPIDAARIIRGGTDLNVTGKALSEARKAGEDTAELEQQMADTRASMSRPKDMVEVSAEEFSKPYIQAAIQAWHDYDGADIYPKVDFSEVGIALTDEQRQRYTDDYMRNYKRILGDFADGGINKREVDEIQKKLRTLKKNLKNRYGGGD